MAGLLLILSPHWFSPTKQFPLELHPAKKHQRSFDPEGKTSNIKYPRSEERYTKIHRLMGCEENIMDKTKPLATMGRWAMKLESGFSYY